MVANFLMTGGMPRPLPSYRSHQHTFWEIVLYTRGTGTATVGDRDIAFHPGTIICNPPGTPHSEVSADGYQNFWVAVRELQTQADIPVVHLYVEHPIFALVPIMQVEQRLRRPASELVLRNLFNTFMLYLDEHLAHDPGERVVSHVVRTITANVQNPSFRIGQAFDGVPLSRDHVRRLFAQRMGSTPARYLIELRMERAKELLRMGFSVKETADKVGLRDQYYFSRLFTRTQGGSPTAYRERMLPR